MEEGLRNVILMGIAFFCILTAFQTSSFFQVFVIFQSHLQASVLEDMGYDNLGFYRLHVIVPTHK
jgi:hypothetical protein